MSDKRAATVPIPRLSGRVVVLSAAEWEGREAWFLPGGGAEGAETAVEAAARELREETGLQVAVTDLGAPVAVSRGIWNDGTVSYRAEDVFFLLHAPVWELTTTGFTASEREQISAHRWWSLSELQTTEAVVFPRALAPLLARLLRGEHPTIPVELPW